MANLHAYFDAVLLSIAERRAEFMLNRNAKCSCDYGAICDACVGPFHSFSVVFFLFLLVSVVVLVLLSGRIHFVFSVVVVVLYALAACLYTFCFHFYFLCLCVFIFLFGAFISL